MAVNLVGQVGRAKARDLLQSSFAQFQADRAVVGLARQVARNEEALEGYREAMTCHLGDFEEYAGLRRSISDREAALSRTGAASRRAQAAASLETLRPGDVIHVPAGRRGGLAVVIDPGTAGGADGPRPTVLTAERQVRRLSLADFPVPVEALHRLRIPKTFNPRNPASRRDLASTLRNTGLAAVPADRSRRPRSGAADDDDLLRLRAELRAHPCHGCDEREDHARWAERYYRLRRETDALSRRVRERTHTIARTFDRICDLLQELGYLHGDEVTTAGRALGALYTELDLVTAECLREGVWDGLAPAELASVVSVLVYESRRDDDATPPQLPPGRTREVLSETERRWRALEERERAHRLTPAREPDLRFAWATYRWASGTALDAVLRDADLAPGDFVRWTKQVVDLLGQLADASRQQPGAEPVGAAARKAADLLRRGVVAYSSVV
jgi:ATP-dependent RNA helicase HelY